MELVVIIVSILLIISGFIGSIIPVIPGPPIAYLGLIVLLFADEFRIQLATNNYFILISMGVVTVLITALDFYLPVWGTKKFGGSSSGTRGSTYGLVIAIVLTILTSGMGILLLILGVVFGLVILRIYKLAEENY